MLKCLFGAPIPAYFAWVRVWKTIFSSSASSIFIALIHPMSFLLPSFPWCKIFSSEHTKYCTYNSRCFSSLNWYFDSHPCISHKHAVNISPMFLYTGHCGRKCRLRSKVSNRSQFCKLPEICRTCHCDKRTLLLMTLTSQLVLMYFMYVHGTFLFHVCFQEEAWNMQTKPFIYKNIDCMECNGNRINSTTRGERKWCLLKIDDSFCRCNHPWWDADDGDLYVWKFVQFSVKICFPVGLFWVHLSV